MARAATLPIVLFVSLLIAGAGSGARSALTADCRMSQLAVTLGPYISEATEQHTLALRFVNRGTHVCVLYGHPRVTLYDMHGVIPFRISHGGDQMISARPPKPVRVQPGQAAFLVLNKNACVGGSSRQATVLKIATPTALGTGIGSFTFPRHMRFPYRDPDYCARADDPGSVITVSPFAPTVRAALNG